MRKALTFKPKDGTCLAARRDLEPGFAVKGRYFYLSAEGSLGKVDWLIIMDIVTIPDE